MKNLKRCLCLLLLGLILLSVGCDTSNREYHQDIVLDLESRDGELVIREWRYLLGSGAEIYYSSHGKTVLLGSTTGGDNGYCPFAEGTYSIAEDGDTVTVKWLFRSGSDRWKEAQFALPD